MQSLSEGLDPFIEASIKGRKALRPGRFPPLHATADTGRTCIGDASGGTDQKARLKIESLRSITGTSPWAGD